MLPAGTYTINTQPGATEWQLIIGNVGKPGQWGMPSMPAFELGRAPMRIGKTAAPVELLTISVDDTANGASLRIEWGTARATVDFMVM